MTAPSLFDPLQLPCGVTLKNRLIKAAMSDALGDGRGLPTEAQNRLYHRWAQGGVAAAIVGEVQGSPRFAENPGNLVLQPEMPGPFEALAQAGQVNGAGLWLQLGHAGALAHKQISRPAGPSAINVPGLICAELPLAAVRRLPADFAETAATAKALGFGGVEVHAAHGFLLSQFLSPLFNTRGDAYGGSAAARRRIVPEVIAAVREAVGHDFPVALKLNASDMLEGGLTEAESLDLIAELDGSSVDLIDITGGTYFPGAASASDRAGTGPYFAEFAARARQRTTKPLMVTGGVKTFDQAHDLLATGRADVVGLARTMVLEPDLPDLWQRGKSLAPTFPRLSSPHPGAVTAWYTMRIAAIAGDAEADYEMESADALAAVKAIEETNAARWQQHFGST